MIALARSEPGMSEKNFDKLNKDVHLLGVKNGVVDLKTPETFPGFLPTESTTLLLRRF